MNIYKIIKTAAYILIISFQANVISMELDERQCLISSDELIQELDKPNLLLSLPLEIIEHIRSFIPRNDPGNAYLLHLSGLTISKKQALKVIQMLYQKVIEKAASFDDLQVRLEKKHKSLLSFSITTRFLVMPIPI